LRKVLSVARVTVESFPTSKRQGLGGAAAKIFLGFAGKAELFRTPSGEADRMRQAAKSAYLIKCGKPPKART
jgi:hypothetical protein